MSTDNCFVTNEWDTLKKVVVGSATSWGPIPLAEEAVDPKSREHILAGTYPTNRIVQLFSLSYIIHKCNRGLGV